MRFLILVAAVNFVLAPAAAGSPEALERARSTVSEWVTAEQAISREEVDWEGERALLHDLITVANARIQRLEAALEETEDRASIADAKRTELLERSDAVSRRADYIRTFLAEIEAALHRLRPRLPDPLREQLEPLYQRLPKNSAETGLGLGERMQAVTGLLSGIRQFDGKITVSETIRTLPGRKGKAHVRLLWLGLGQAYYLAPDDAGFGVPGRDEWEWHSRPDLAERVGEAIALAERTAGEPKLIELPVKLTEGAAE